MKWTHPDVHSYYDHTRFDYRRIWNRRRRDVAVHFGYYDEHAHRHEDALDNMNRVLAGYAGIQAGERVLDAGCGVGNACFWLAEHLQARVTGVNIVASQIADCRQQAALKNLPEASFVEADFCNIPFENDTFDVVWACESVCHAPEKAAFYREAFRVLKPGGRLVMAEYMRQNRPVSTKGEQLLAAWLRPWAIPDIDTADEHRQHATGAGFEQIVIHDATANVRVSLRNLHDLSAAWLPFGKVFRFFHIVNDIRLDNVKASMRQYEALREDAWMYGILTARKIGFPLIDADQR